MRVTRQRSAALKGAATPSASGVCEPATRYARHKTSPSPSSILADLPEEILGHVLSKLSADMLLRGALAACRWFRTVALSQIKALRIGDTDDCGGALVALASRMGTWAALRAMVVTDLSELYVGMSFGLDGTGFSRVTELSLTMSSETEDPVVSGLVGRDALVRILNRMPNLTGLRAAPNDKLPLHHLAAVIVKCRPEITRLCLDLIPVPHAIDANLAEAMRTLSPLQLVALKIDATACELAPLQFISKLFPLKQLHVHGCDSAQCDSDVQAMLAERSSLEVLTLYGCDLMTGSGLRLPPGGDVTSSLTALSIHNCLGLTPEGLASIDSRLPLKRLFIGELDFDKDECAFDGRHLLSLAARFGNLEELHIDVPISVDFPELDSYFMVEKNCTKLKRLYFGWHELAQPVTSNAASLPHLYACLLAGFRDPHGRSRLASWSDADCVCGENTMAASQYLPF